MPILDPAVYSPAKVAAIAELLTQNLAVVLLAVFSIVAVLRFNSKLLGPLLILLLFLELRLFAPGNLPTAPADKLLPPKLPVSMGLSRYASTADTHAFTGLGSYWNHLKVRRPFAQELDHSELIGFQRLHQISQLLPANLNITFRQFNAAGYSAIVLKNYAQIFNSSHVNTVDIDLSDRETLRLLGVNYLVTGYPDDYLKSLPQLHQISSNPPIYQAQNPSPRAFLQNSNGQVEITRYTPLHITISARLNQPDNLILTDSWYSGWQAALNGRQIPLTPYRQAFRSVALPSGNHQLTFSYQPTSVKIGLTITSLGVALTALFLTWPKKTQSRSLS